MNTHNLLISLNQTAEIAIDSGLVEKKEWNHVGEVGFYFIPARPKSIFPEKDYFSIEFEGIQISWREDELKEIEASSVDKWGLDLFEWSGRLRLALTEGIAQEVERKHNELEEARAKSN